MSNKLTMQIDLIEAQNKIASLSSQVSEVMYSCANAYENEKAKNTLLSKAFRVLLGDLEDLGEKIHLDSMEVIRAALETFEEGDVKHGMRNYLNNQ